MKNTMKDISRRAFLSTSAIGAALALAPASRAFAQKVNETTEETVEEINTDVALALSEIAQKEVITSADIQEIGENVGSTKITRLEENFTFLEIKPYQPLATKTISMARNGISSMAIPVENRQAVGLLLRTETEQTEIQYDNSGIVRARVYLHYDRIVEPFFGTNCYKVIKGSTEVLNIYDNAQITLKIQELNGWGTRFATVADAYAGQLDSNTSVGMRIRQEFTTGIFNEHFVYSTSNAYFAPMDAGYGIPTGGVEISLVLYINRGGTVDYAPIMGITFIS